MYETASQSGADVVQGRAEVFSEIAAADAPVLKTMQEDLFKKANNVYSGTLTESDVFNGFLLKSNHVGFLWAKLIRRETYLEAFSHISFSRCTLAEDFLQYFFISYKAKKYVGISAPVYRYTIDTGITSAQKITDLARWEHICTTATVFVVIFSAIKENPAAFPFTTEQMESLRFKSRSYLADNLIQLAQFVEPSLKEPARSLLCDYWGESFVCTMEDALKA